MDVNKNTYTILFSAIMVIIIAAILSATSLRLEPLQTKYSQIDWSRSK